MLDHNQHHHNPSYAPQLGQQCRMREAMWGPQSRAPLRRQTPGLLCDTAAASVGSCRPNDRIQVCKQMEK